MRAPFGAPDRIGEFLYLKYFFHAQRNRLCWLRTLKTPRHKYWPTKRVGGIS